MLNDIIGFVALVRAGELRAVFWGLMLALFVAPIAMLHARPMSRYRVSKGRQDVEITYISERATPENQYNRMWAQGELADGQMVWLPMRNLLVRQSETVSAYIVCTQYPPVECIGRAPLPIFPAL